ncbi:hypothetical protein PV08_02346 [Exophiala spinifera]|uniref:Heterokaryon incompatibility domain-containing protein n=1 Tax=Exophiala spinifera TaxID=91928 RepID=A0A0D2C391_9EURO|nr:uncharacterized protein PV08_02346 [Exophiala spinifera]KIW18059.1 hypothetical protein PV08_02346 [Exophiala spinifera]
MDVFTSDSKKSSRLDGLMYGKVPEENAWSAGSMATTRTWLRRCENYHSRCRNRIAEQADEPPSRLIDVSLLARTGTVRLVAGTPNTGRYAALSHRWVSGPMPSWATTRSNVEKRLQGFELLELPNTIQEALTYISELGLSYLWVDSVCIIQDDEADWSGESVQMLKVFGNAALSLFTDSAQNDDYSFLANCRQGSFQQRSGVSLTIVTANGPAQANLVKRYSPYEVAPPARASDLFQSDVVHSPLSTRAWILQEQLVSRRQLHFGEFQQYWICGEVCQAEDGSDLLAFLPSWFRWTSPKTDILKRLDPSNIEHRQHNLWAQLVETYTHRSLTRRQDRLLALSGLARLSGQLYSDRYLVGCWTRCIGRNLLWVSALKHPPRKKEDPSEPSHRRASLLKGIPTWSWVAADGAVEYPHLRRGNGEADFVKLQYEVISSPKCIYGNADVFSATPKHSSSLVLRGVLHPATVGEARDITFGSAEAPHWYRGSTDFQGRYLQLHDGDGQHLGSMIPDRVCEKLEDHVFLLSAWELDGMCPCCQKYKSRYRHFLVLQPTHKSWTTYYRRVGYGWSYNRTLSFQAYEVDKAYHRRWKAAPEIIHLL